VALLVHDEQLCRPGLFVSLGERGIEAQPLSDFDASGKADPEVVRRVAGRLKARRWVLVTMDLTIDQDHPGFDWGRYAIAWVIVPRTLRGAAVERHKANVVQRYAHLMCEQRPGDLQTYTATQHFKHPPSVGSIMQRYY
jgi:hypothetical protein